MTRAAAGQAGHAGGRGRDSREAAGVAARQEPAADVALPEQTLALAASGDDAAWRLVLERYGRRVFAMVLSRLRDPDLAEELTQAVFVKVAEQWATGEYTERGRFESWLFRITMNRVRDEARRRRRRSERTDAGADINSIEHLPAAAHRERSERDRVRSALERLSDAERDVITLRHHGGLGFKAMASLLGEPVGTLLARHHRAIRKLRAMMDPAGAPPAPEDDS